jgi:hypothetical protein
MLGAILFSTSGSVAAAPDGAAKQPAAVHMPAAILGLAVQQEDVTKKVAAEKGPFYVDHVSLFSLRESSQLLEATVELARFRTSVAPRTEEFERSFVLQIGGPLPIVVRVDGQQVFVTTVKGLITTIWFRHGYMGVLSIRNTYKQPKALLREVLAVTP